MLEEEQSRFEQGQSEKQLKPQENLHESFRLVKDFVVNSNFSKKRFGKPVNENEFQEKVSFLEQHKNLFKELISTEKSSEVLECLIKLATSDQVIHIDKDSYAERNYETNNEAAKLAFKVLEELQPTIENLKKENPNLLDNSLLCVLYQASFYSGNLEQKDSSVKYLLNHLDEIREGIKSKDETTRKRFLNLIPTLYHSDKMEAEGRDIIRNVLKEAGLPIPELISDWNKGGGTFYKAEENVKRIIEIEMAQSGSAKFLYEKFGISDFGRYPKEILLDMVENYENKDKPYGLIVFPKNDHSGAFYRDTLVLKNFYKQLNEDFLLRIVECESKWDIAKALIKLNKKYNPKDESGHKISLLILGGHGIKDYILFGGDDARNKLRAEDLMGKGVKKTSKFFEENPTIILNSCSTGSEGGIGQELSKVMGAKVIAPKTPTCLKSLRVTEEDGKFIFDAEFLSGEEKSLYEKGIVKNNK